ncbi:glycine-rich cell wall structural protein-like [Capsicum annuum]|uniref:glycine-rich cell wall structural protein-like n=1 Tax=Capsicum annuum TaxID=4072 RepID=UPI001FB0906A|nr:glycine-rich cell wall structural protein-like [Capsicum annuum]
MAVALVTGGCVGIGGLGDGVSGFDGDVGGLDGHGAGIDGIGGGVNGLGTGLGCGLSALGGSIGGLGGIVSGLGGMGGGLGGIDLRASSGGIAGRVVDVGESHPDNDADADARPLKKAGIYATLGDEERTELRNAKYSKKKKPVKEYTMHMFDNQDFRSMTAT